VSVTVPAKAAEETTVDDKTMVKTKIRFGFLEKIVLKGHSPINE
jgi:hypothetical protein